MDRPDPETLYARFMDYARLYVRAAGYASLLAFLVFFAHMLRNDTTSILVTFNEYHEFWPEVFAFGLAGLLLCVVVIDYCLREFR